MLECAPCAICCVHMLLARVMRLPLLEHVALLPLTLPSELTLTRWEPAVQLRHSILETYVASSRPAREFFKVKGRGSQRGRLAVARFALVCYFGKQKIPVHV